MTDKERQEKKDKISATIDKLIGDALDKVKKPEDLPEDFGKQLREDYDNLCKSVTFLIGALTIIEQQFNLHPEASAQFEEAAIKLVASLGKDANNMVKKLHFAELEISVKSIINGKEHTNG